MSASPAISIRPEWQPGIGMRSLEMRARQIGASLDWQDLHDAAGN